MLFVYTFFYIVTTLFISTMTMATLVQKKSGRTFENINAYDVDSRAPS